MSVLATLGHARYVAGIVTEQTGRQGRLAAAGTLLVLAGIVGYFIAVLRWGARLPWVRNDAVPNWLLVVSGLILASVALSRAARGRRLLASSLLGVNVLLAVWFAGMLYVFSVVPPATGPAIGKPAPAFALADQAGKIVRLEDFRGSPLLLVFYRGHW